MRLVDERFTLREIAKVFGDNSVTLQSWADKGWARISPAPGPGRIRELHVLDVYALSVAIRLSQHGINPKLANQIATRAVCSEDDSDVTGTTVSEAMGNLNHAFRYRETAYPYMLVAKVGQSLSESGFLGLEVDLFRPYVSDRERKTRRRSLALDGVFVGLNLTDLLYHVDKALSLQKYYGPAKPPADLSLEIKLDAISEEESE
jgi:hypothetical protein